MIINMSADICMYNTILSPDVALDPGGDYTEEEWDKFEFKKYSAKVLELAIKEIKTALDEINECAGKRHGSKLKYEYVNGSAYIDSPEFYNYRGDYLEFQIRCLNGDKINHSDLLVLYNDLKHVFKDTWESEFGNIYNIYEQLGMNYCLGEFYNDEVMQNA